MDIQEIEDMITSLSFDTPRASASRDYNFQDILDLVNEQRNEKKRLENLTSKLHVGCKTSKEKLARLEKERIAGQREVTKLKEEHAIVDRKIAKLQTEIRDSNYKIELAKNKSALSDAEREHLQKNQEELETYKNLTGIRWSFNVPNNMIEGMITNSRKTEGKVKVFNLETSMPSKKIKETLWGYIKDAGTENWNDIPEGGEENKENDN